MTETEIVVYERNDPLLSFAITTVSSTGVVSPFDFTGSTLEFYVKSTPRDPDTSALATYLSTGTNPPIVVTNATGGLCTVLASSANATLNPGVFYYRLDAIKATRRTTVLSGAWKVVNI